MVTKQDAVKAKAAFVRLARIYMPRQMFELRSGYTEENSKHKVATERNDCLEIMEFFDAVQEALPEKVKVDGFAAMKQRSYGNRKAVKK